MKRYNKMDWMMVVILILGICFTISSSLIGWDFKFIGGFMFGVGLSHLYSK